MTNVDKNMTDVDKPERSVGIWAGAVLVIAFATMVFMLPFTAATSVVAWAGERGYAPWGGFSDTSGWARVGVLAFAFAMAEALERPTKGLLAAVFYRLGASAELTRRAAIVGNEVVSILVFYAGARYAMATEAGAWAAVALAYLLYFVIGKALIARWPELGK